MRRRRSTKDSASRSCRSTMPPGAVERGPSVWSSSRSASDVPRTPKSSASGPAAPPRAPKPPARQGPTAPHRRPPPHSGAECPRRRSGSVRRSARQGCGRWSRPRRPARGAEGTAEFRELAEAMIVHSVVIEEDIERARSGLDELPELRQRLRVGLAQHIFFAPRSPPKEDATHGCGGCFVRLEQDDPTRRRLILHKGETLAVRRQRRREAGACGSPGRRVSAQGPRSGSHGD